MRKVLELLDIIEQLSVCFFSEVAENRTEQNGFKWSEHGLYLSGTKINQPYCKCMSLKISDALTKIKGTAKTDWPYFRLD